MAGCYSESWTMKDLTDSLKNMHKDNKVIVVPIFQRGKRWKEEQENTFIDSLKRGYPVGTMLFYKRVENNQEVYTLVDGLQRGNTIKKFMTSPTRYFSCTSIPSEIINSTFNALGLHGQEKDIKHKISDLIVGAIRKFESVDEIETYDVAKAISRELPTNSQNIVDKLVKILKPFLKQYKDTNEEISKSTIPVIVYSGDEDNLPLIFDRINSQGTPLTQYEVYAASWPLDKKFVISNDKIIEKIMKKYDSLADDEYSLYGYDRDEFRLSKTVSAFEYLFGLGKHLNQDYKFLNFEKNEEDDEINTMAFELVSACINEGRDGIKTLYNKILEIDVKLFECRLIEAVKFVEKIIAPITRFKGNSRGNNPLLYSKFQILSMIACTFKEKYDLNNMKEARKTWNANRTILEKNMVLHFVYDILSNEWSNGGTSKIYSVSKPNKYMKGIPKTAWESSLSGCFEQENMRNEKSKVSGTTKADLVILNCIYLSTFTALDQLSIEKFDVEHIAPKDQMKDLIEDCKHEGLPISNIGNLCYLPEYVNRSKKKNNFYQDTKYLNKVNLSDVENKYSFTKEEDLKWMDISYNKGDYEKLKDSYMDFLKKRFNSQKEKFYLSLGIQ
ncbi:DUF262 domain-containing protein [Clostridium estertheticum]|uniref:DUF262 domain-containing protein n=1 Tax=Clostridium estertheticum TaxID=238834 RepID=UPI001C0D83D3|nr:DUF262 domain-containing protein [Clostridium estertheticum]MBU3176506.1 DUF262 domain-containing protein [Clostridium estertheticum]